MDCSLWIYPCNGSVNQISAQRRFDPSKETTFNTKINTNSRALLGRSGSNRFLLLLRLQRSWRKFIQQAIGRVPYLRGVKARFMPNGREDSL